MAVTKIKPIRGTVNKALAYILDPQKTDDAFYVSSYGCAASDAAEKEFEWTRNLAVQQGMQMPKVLLGLGKQKDMLIAAGAAVFHALRHGVILHPDDVVAQIPAGIAEGKSKHPRNTNHVLRLAALNLVVESHSLTVSAVGVLRVNEISLIALSSVGVRDVQPERSIRTQNAPDFGKHFRQARDIFLRRCLSADLSIHAVITERVIRRGRHTAMNAVVGQSFQDFKAIAGMNDVKLYGGVPPCSFH